MVGERQGALIETIRADVSQAVTMALTGRTSGLHRVQRKIANAQKRRPRSWTGRACRASLNRPLVERKPLKMKAQMTRQNRPIKEGQQRPCRVHQADSAGAFDLMRSPRPDADVHFTFSFDGLSAVIIELKRVFRQNHGDFEQHV